MSIKNWTVISKGINKGARGISNYIYYLTDLNHDSHIKTESIIPIFGDSREFSNQAISEAFERQSEIDKAGKGGRPLSSFAQSFVISFPPGYRPSQEQWKAIAADIFKVIKGKTQSSTDDLKKRIFINVHQETENKNSHLNIVVSKIWDGEIQNVLKQKSIITALKNQVNQSALKHCGWNQNDYTPKETNTNMKLWQARQRKAEQAENRANQAVEYLKRFVANLQKLLVPDLAKKSRNKAQNEVNQAVLSGCESDPFKEVLEVFEQVNEVESGITVPFLCRACEKKVVQRKGSLCLSCQGKQKLSNNKNNGGKSYERQKRQRQAKDKI